MSDELNRPNWARLDLLIVSIAVMVLFLLAGRLDLLEAWAEWSSTLEAWELDEAPIAMSLAVFGVAWYAFRRLRESKVIAQRLSDANRELSRQIEERIEAQQEQATSENRYRRLLDVSPAGALIHVDGRIVFANRAAVELFSAPSVDSLVGAQLFEFIHADFHDIARERQRAAQDGCLDQCETEQVFVKVNGEPFDVACSASAASHGEQRAVLTIFRDISDDKLAEQVMRDAKEAADHANRAKSEFLANMSHELRTPLNSVIGFAELLKSEGLGPLGHPEYRQYAAYINDAGAYLLTLINDILDLSKIEAGKLDLLEEEVDLAETVRSCLILVAERAQSGELEMDSSVAEDLPTLRADQRKLKQILINLLDNAIKFTPAGGRIEIKVQHHAAAGFEIAVSDTGIGIDAEDMTIVFGRFAQIENNLARKHGGAGLGLPLTRSLIELHDGALDLESEVGVGTTARIRIPPERIWCTVRPSNANSDCVAPTAQAV